MQDARTNEPHPPLGPGTACVTTAARRPPCWCLRWAANKAIFNGLAAARGHETGQNMDESVDLTAWMYEIGAWLSGARALIGRSYAPWSLWPVIGRESRSG